MLRYLKVILLATIFCQATKAADPLPIDPLWKSVEFRRIVTGSFGIDSRIEPQITNDEESYLNDSAKKMADTMCAKEHVPLQSDYYCDRK